MLGAGTGCAALVQLHGARGSTGARLPLRVRQATDGTLWPPLHDDRQIKTQALVRCCTWRKQDRVRGIARMAAARRARRVPLPCLQASWRCSTGLRGSSAAAACRRTARRRTWDAWRASACALPMLVRAGSL